MADSAGILTGVTQSLDVGMAGLKSMDFRDSAFEFADMCNFSREIGGMMFLNTRFYIAKSVRVTHQQIVQAAPPVPDPCIYIRPEYRGHKWFCF
jgi:hypothetical protein